MIIEYIKRTDSTNREVRKYSHNMVILCSESQTKGRGQGENCWESEAGKNLTFSIKMHPFFLPAERQFELSKAISVTIVKVLQNNGIAATIKWPNDIYVGDKKICGILIECTISGNGTLSEVIIGVGLNVNQMIFKSDAPNPTSMALDSGKVFDTHSILEQIANDFERKYDMIGENLFSIIDRTYLSSLYRREGFYKYKDSVRGEFEAKLSGISRFGALMLTDREDITTEYQFKEVSFVLPSAGIEKICPICGTHFICRHDDIANCDCSKVTLTEKQLSYISENYSSCLCLNCLKGISKGNL